MARMGKEELGVAHLDRPQPANFADHARHRRRAAAAAPDMAGVLAIDAVEREGKPVGITLAADLAVADDVDAGPLHVADREMGRVVLGLFEQRRWDAPD